MDELAIQKHDFQQAKNEIQAFSNKTPEDLGLSRVDVDGGLFGLFDHKVTGVELNKLTSQIQKHLISYNEMCRDLIKEFGQVYAALEALDKDYIDAILISFQEAEAAHEKTRKNQTDISKTIEKQKKTIQVLQQFKDRLSKLEHLENIDSLWATVQSSENRLNQINNQVDILIRKGKAIETELKLLDEFRQTISAHEHIKDIDGMWDNLQSTRDCTEEQSVLIASLQESTSSLSVLIENEKKENTSQLEALKKKIQFAYIIAGSAVAISLAQVLLGLLGVI